MLTKAQKLEQSEQLRSRLSEATALFLLENTGLNVNQINQLRSQVRKSEATYKVVKNSVVRLAVAGTDMEALSPHLVGPKALAFTSGDGVELAKILKDFIDDHPALSFQRVYLEGQILAADEAEKIARLPAREELLTRLVFLLQSPIRRLAVALNTPIQKFSTAVNQIADQKDTNES